MSGDWLAMGAIAALAVARLAAPKRGSSAGRVSRQRGTTVWDYLTPEQATRLRAGDVWQVDWQADPDEAIFANVPLAALTTWLRSFHKAVQNIREGRPSRSTQDPIEVLYDPNTDAFLITDGQHRFAAAVARKDKTVPVVIWHGGYSDYATPASEDRWSPQRGSRAVGNAAFRRWFGNSKVVDDLGQPLPVYHGTRTRFDSFSDTFRPMFFTPFRKYAEVYGPVAMKVYLRIERPFDTEIDSRAMRVYNDEFVPFLRRYKHVSRGLEPLAPGEPVPFTWADHVWRFLRLRKVKYGKDEYDGLLVDEGPSTFLAGEDVVPPHKAFVPLYATQIKAVDNSGAWDPQDARISFNRRRSNER